MNSFLAMILFVIVVGILIFIALWTLGCSFANLYKEAYDIDKTKKGNDHE